MRLTIATTEGTLHIEFEPAAPDAPTPEQSNRETQLDAMVERTDPHPEVDRPIGFRRTDPDGDPL